LLNSPGGGGLAAQRAAPGRRPAAVRRSAGQRGAVREDNAARADSAARAVQAGRGDAVAEVTAGARRRGCRPHGSAGATGAGIAAERGALLQSASRQTASRHVIHASSPQTRRRSSTVDKRTPACPVPPSRRCAAFSAPMSAFVVASLLPTERNRSEGAGPSGRESSSLPARAVQSQVRVAARSCVFAVLSALLARSKLQASDTASSWSHSAPAQARFRGAHQLRSATLPSLRRAAAAAPPAPRRRGAPSERAALGGATSDAPAPQRWTCAPRAWRRCLRWRPSSSRPPTWRLSSTRQAAPSARQALPRTRARSSRFPSAPPPRADASIRLTWVPPAGSAVSDG